MPESDDLDFPRAPFPLKDFASNWNEAFDAIRQTRDAYASNFPRGFGPLAKPRRGLMVRDIFIGKIATTGPKGSEADYKDARYWITREVPDPSLTASTDVCITDNLKTIDDPIAPNNGLMATVTATNLHELPEGGPQTANKGSHIISSGTLVLCIGIAMPASAGNICYIFEYSPEPILLLTGSALARPGAYNANVFSGPDNAPDISSSNPLSNGDFGTSGAAIYAFNAAEINNSGTPTHWIDAGGIFLGVWIGVAPDGTACFAFNGMQSTFCS